MTRGDSDETLDRLRQLATFIPDLQRPDFAIGEWEGGETRADGSITVPYFSYSAPATHIIRSLPIEVFDWRAWLETPDAQALVADHARIAGATAEQLVKLSTAIVRSDRFSEGSIAGAFESGLILAIARRAAALTTNTSSA